MHHWAARRSVELLAKYRQVQNRKRIFRGLNVFERGGMYLERVQMETGDLNLNAALRLALEEDDLNVAMLIASLLPPVEYDAISSHETPVVCGEIVVE